MFPILTWAAAGVGALVLVLALARGWRTTCAMRTGVFFPFGGAAVCLTVIGALLTLPSGGVWSTGERLAPGMLLGTVLILAAALSVAPTLDASRQAFHRASVALAGAALGVGLLVGWYGGNIDDPYRVHDPLGGLALGACLTGLLISVGLRLTFTDDAALMGAETAETATLALIVLAATTHLGSLHWTTSGGMEWQPLPTLWAAAAAVCLAVRTAVSTQRRLLPTAALVYAPAIVVAAALGYLLHGTPAFTVAVVAGMLGYGLIGWLARSGAEPGGPRWGNVRGLAALLVLGAGFVSFRELHGYGLGLGVIGGLVVLGEDTAAGTHARTRGSLLRDALTMGLLMLLARVYEQVNDARHEPSPELFYVYLALVFGVLLPGLLANCAGAAVATPTGALMRVGFAGLLAAAAPLLVWILLTERAQAALLVGLAGGMAVLLGTRSERGSERAGGLAPAASLLAIAVAFSAVQFTRLLTPLALASRAERISIMMGAVAVAALGWWITRERGVPAVPIEE